MSVTVHPDPQEPAGGFAFLELPDGSLGAGPVTVAVSEVYGGRWLGPVEEVGKISVGAANWQGERHDFGPYPVHRHEGADWVRIGPEIVNKIDEYTPLNLIVGSQAGDVTWPDNVPPRAGAAVLGGLHSTARAPEQEADQALVGKPPEPAAEPESEPNPTPPENPAPIKEKSPKRNLLVPVLLVLLLIAALISAWLLVPRDESEADPQVVAQDTCTRASVTALGGFTAMEKAIRACGDALSADTVLAIVENAARRDDPGALLLFGTLYDGAELDGRIETVIGLSFDHDAARAAEYYSRAASAGSGIARTRLGVTCVQLAASNKTLAKGAYDDFCR
jgi:hypothetical protein